MFMYCYCLFREAAFQRHKLLVNACFEPGPRRDAEHLFHRRIVRAVYGF